MLSVCGTTGDSLATTYTHIMGKNFVRENTQYLDTKNPRYRNIPKMNVNKPTCTCIGIVVLSPSSVRYLKTRNSALSMVMQHMFAAAS